MHKIIIVEVLSGYRLALTFDDGIHGLVDVGYLAGKGAFSPWENRAAFEAVQIAPSGELTWGEGMDLCADAMYLKIAGTEPEKACPLAEI